MTVARPVTNVDASRGRKKAVWFVDSAEEREDIYGGPSRYGPRREYVANCVSLEIADRIVQLWNAAPA